MVISEKIKNSIENVGFREKIGTSFGAIKKLFIVLISVICVSLVYMGSSFWLFNKQEYATLRMVTNSINDLSSIERGINEFNSALELEEKKEVIRQLVEEGLIFDDEYYNKLYKTYKGDSADVDSYMRSVASLKKDLVRVKEYTDNGDVENAVRVLENDYIETSDGITDKISGIFNNCIESSDKIFTRRIIFIVVIELLVVLGIFITFRVVKRITEILTETIMSGINNVKNISSKLEDGCLTVKNDYTYDDELGEMAESLVKSINLIKEYIVDAQDKLGKMSEGNFNIQQNNDLEYRGEFIFLRDSFAKIVISFNKLFRMLDESITIVSSSSEEVSASTQTLTEGAAEQAGSVEELLETCKVMLEKSNNNVGIAEKTKDATINVKNTVNDSNEKMNILRDSMQDIEESSKAIEQITNTIKDIAGQTNLLALNAAIEAARAGDAGKGFAVVAAEVRKLADEVSIAVEDTGVLVNSSISSVNSVNLIVEDTAKSLGLVVKKVDDTVNLVDKITNESKEQAKSVDEMTKGVNSISEVVQMNSASAEETAAAMEELSSQAQMLNEEMNKFQFVK